jgi:hypothetical protein
MNTNEVKKFMRDYVAVFFGDGHVYYSWQKKTRTPVPYITVSFSNSAKRKSKIVKYDKEADRIKNYWQKNITMTINLYTQGSNISPEGCDPQYENTAMSDLEDFITFMLSDNGGDILSTANISAVQDGDVNDLTSLLNESSYRYRAMVRLSVGFVECAYGDYGMNGKQIPNASNGGNTDMISDDSSIENIIITGGLKK